MLVGYLTYVVGYNTSCWLVISHTWLDIIHHAGWLSLIHGWIEKHHAGWLSHIHGWIEKHHAVWLSHIRGWT